MMVSLAYRKRAIPLTWTWVDHVKGHSKPEALLTLLCYGRTLLPQGRAASLGGDNEFGVVEVLEQVEKWCWHYVLREKGRTLVCPFGKTEWHSFGSYVEKPGRKIWLGKG